MKNTMQCQVYHHSPKEVMLDCVKSAMRAEYVAKPGGETWATLAVTEVA